MVPGFLGDVEKYFSNEGWQIGNSQCRGKVDSSSEKEGVY